MKEKVYYKYLDVLRIVCVILVFLYHLNILKGGYLAVCTFFALSAYLSTIKSFKKDKFSLKDYFKRLLKIYIPLIVVVFITVPIVLYIKDFNWLNLKREVLSIILGINNFWQLNANLDYFARQISSPFMHFWYISILLQFELVFPIIFWIFRGIGDKLSKIIPIIILSTLSILGSLYFYNSSLNSNIMICYYDTISRGFSLMFGMLLGFIHSYYKPLVPKFLKNSVFKYINLFLYLIVLIELSIFIAPTFKYFNLIMILITIISLRIIDYCVFIEIKKENWLSKVLRLISSISYEIFLIQYPVVFVFQYLNISKIYSITLIVIITLIISLILHYILTKAKRLKVLKILLRILLASAVSFGIYKFIIEKDYTKELKRLEEELTVNASILKEKQEQYKLEVQEAQKSLEEELSSLNFDEDSLKEYVTNLSVVGVGDSVMLGAVNSLYQTFPKGYFDAKISRTAWVANDILKSLKSQNMLGDTIILNLGANGDCPSDCKKAIMDTIGNRDIYWVNVTNDKEVHVNARLKEFAKSYSNIHIIDWENISAGHPEYFVADKIHLTSAGIKAYTNTIYDAIYNNYLEGYKAKKEEIIKKYEEEIKNKITFYGNDLLLNVYNDLEKDFQNDRFIIDSNFNNETLLEKINNEIKDNTLTKKLVFIFDENAKIDYKKLTDLCKENEVYILITKGLEDTMEDVNIIDFSKELEKHSNYLMIDKIHLTKEGNIALKDMLNEYLEKYK